MSELATMLENGELGALPEAEVLEFVRGQRWFGAKTRELAGLRVLDQGLLRTELPLLLEALVEIRYATGTHDVYQLLAGIREDGEEPAGAAIASGERWTSYEALADPFLARELIHLVRSGATLTTGEGTVEFRTLGPIEQDASAWREVRSLGLEQSNSSVVLDDELILKVYRRLEPGINPELELLHFLTSHGFENVPPLSGWWTYSGPLMGATLGIVQKYLAGAVDGWSLALDEIGSEPEAFVSRLRRLGEVIGRMHAVLASDPDDPAFAPEEPSTESLALLTATVDEEIDDVFGHLPDDEALAPIAGRGEDIRGLLRELTSVGSIGRTIRHHGDLHLGQVLWVDGDWQVIDFEGEPARSVPERRRKRSPLRDVAGMLRSFAYAVSVAGGEPADGFEQRARSDFLAGYLGAMHGTPILPSAQATERLIRIFELEKAIYELRYELSSRPDWVHVPTAGILRLLEEASE
jgi:maltokinase